MQKDKAFRVVAAAFALIALCLGAHAANQGIPPGNGFQMVDGNWLQGLANGTNASFASGISAAGSTQATATVLPTATTLIEVDTVASSTGVNLPTANAGIELSIYNNGANTLTVYPAVANNAATGAQDTINNSTSTTVTSHASLYCFVAKTGLWACK
jgi:hypothetical protein